MDDVRSALLDLRQCRAFTICTPSIWPGDRFDEPSSLVPGATEPSRSDPVLRIRFNGLWRQNVLRCERVFVGIRLPCRPHLTQFLHNSHLRLARLTD